MNLGSELFIAIVAPAGTRRSELTGGLASSLALVGFRTKEIRLSSLLERCACFSKATKEGDGARIKHLQDIGNVFREKLHDGAALARASIVAIREARMELTGDPDIPAQRTAYILDQLKHPSEVEFFRRTYGSCFILVAGHAPKSSREEQLAADIADSLGRAGDIAAFKSEADAIIEADEKQAGDFGQNTKDTYPLADLFVDLSLQGGGAAIERFIELVFGHPFHTPTREEYAMYHASAASLRSSDSARQVGASIATTDGDVIAVGANEVPVRGGGLYWWPTPSPDARDQALLHGQGSERADQIKMGALMEILDRINGKKWFIDDVATRSNSDRARELLLDLKGTQFMNIGEFGRTVHAEMAALLDAARRGVSINKQAMFVTTFPCHNCAKHIVAAGIEKVVYLEPYPKSRAGFLHREEVEIDPEQGVSYGDKLVFWRFSGVAPRQYNVLFRMTERGGKGDLLAKWYANRAALKPLYVVRNAASAYLVAEREELENLPSTEFSWDRNKLASAR